MLCGGSGSSKVVSAIANYASEKIEPSFVTNVGDNFWYHGLLVCPDTDITVYCLAGLLNSTKGWGIQDDSFEAKSVISKMAPQWFSLGDRDFGLCLWRTQLYQTGWPLSSITKELCSRLGVKYQVIPASDDRLQTFVRTSVGNLHLQEFWVKNGGTLDTFGVEYLGIMDARPSERISDRISGSVLICPANPVTSILPIVNLKGMTERLRKSKVIAVSPFVGDRAFSGPAADLMRGLKIESSSLGVAKLYSKFLKIMFLDKNEEPGIVKSIKDLSVECVQTNTRIESEADKERIAEELTSVF